MADNIYSVDVPNPLQALLIGQKAYGDAQTAQKQQAITDARQQASQMFQGGDYKGALSTLFGAGDTQGAQIAATQLQNAWTQQHTASQDAINNQFRTNADKRAGAAEGRAVYEFNNTPDQYGTGPNGEIIDRYAEAKTRAAGLTPPDNYENNPDFGKVEGAPRLRPISGGPADPSTISTNAEAKQGSGMGDGAVEIAARRLKEGDLSALTNIGRGAQASRDLGRIQNKLADILVKEDGLSSSDAAKKVSSSVQAFKASTLGQGAEARTAGVREANLNLILRAADAAIPAALQASHDVARTGFVPLNKIIQGGQVMTSDPTLKRFGMANLQLAEHWARAMNPTGVMRESDRDKALSFLSTADSEETYKQAVDQLHTQIVRERDAVKGAPVTPAAPSFRPNDIVNDPSQGNLTGSPKPGAYVWSPDKGLVSQ